MRIVAFNLIYRNYLIFLEIYLLSALYKMAYLLSLHQLHPLLYVLGNIWYG